MLKLNYSTKTALALIAGVLLVFFNMRYKGVDHHGTLFQTKTRMVVKDKGRFFFFFILFELCQELQFVNFKYVLNQPKSQFVTKLIKCKTEK